MCYQRRFLSSALLQPCHPRGDGQSPPALQSLHKDADVGGGTTWLAGCHVRGIKIGVSGKKGNTSGCKRCVLNCSPLQLVTAGVLSSSPGLCRKRDCPEAPQEKTSVLGLQFLGGAAVSL